VHVSKCTCTYVCVFLERDYVRVFVCLVMLCVCMCVCVCVCVCLRARACAYGCEEGGEGVSRFQLPVALGPTHCAALLLFIPNPDNIIP
jgi:hypothetical protein